MPRRLLAAWLALVLAAAALLALVVALPPALTTLPETGRSAQLGGEAQLQVLQAGVAQVLAVLLVLLVPALVPLHTMVL